MMVETKITPCVIYNSDLAASYRTDISGWVDRNGLFFGDNENAARYSGCTHKQCTTPECETLTEKQHRCEWQGFALHQGLGWGQIPDETNEWRQHHELHCGGQLIQLVRPSSPLHRNSNPVA